MLYSHGDVLSSTDVFSQSVADGVVNAAGMGFNGYDEKGEPLWDKFTSAKVKNIEV